MKSYLAFLLYHTTFRCDLTTALHKQIGNKVERCWREGDILCVEPNMTQRSAGMEPMAPCSLRDGLVSPAESRYNAQDGLADNDVSFLSQATGGWRLKAAPGGCAAKPTCVGYSGLRKD